MTKIKIFLAEENGSVSLWNLFWLVGFCAIMGLAVDLSAAMNTKARLQLVADSASHAGVMDIFPVASDSIVSSVTYGVSNSNRQENVVGEDDVVLGRWDSDARVFDTSGTLPHNAIRVLATRDASRANQLYTSFLKVVGFTHWDINAVSTAALGDIPFCANGGLFAEGGVDQVSNNLMTGSICVHGESFFKISQNNLITCGVVLSTPAPQNYQNGTPPVPTPDCDTDYASLGNEALIAQSFSYRSLRVHTELEYENVRDMLDAFVAGETVNDPLSLIPPYIEAVVSVSPQTVNSLANSGKLAAGTLYVATCGGSGTRISLKGIIQNVGLYTDCEISVKRDPTVSHKKAQKTASGQAANCNPDKNECAQVDWQAEIDQANWDCAQLTATGQYETYTTMLDTAPGKTYKDGVSTDTFTEACAIEPGANGLWDNVFIFTTANENGNRDQVSIDFANHIQLGRLDGCTEGGGVRVYAGGSIKTNVGMVYNDFQAVVLGDAMMTAKVDGVKGILIKAANDIKYTAGGMMGGCGIEEGDGESDAVVSVRRITLVQ